MVAQSRADVVVTQQAAFAQDRDDLLREDIEATGQPGWHDVEAVGRTVLEPGLDVVGNPFRRSPSDHGRPPGAARADESLAYRDRPRHHGHWACVKCRSRGAGAALHAVEKAAD